MNINQLIRELNAAPSKMVIAAQSVLNKEVPKLIADLQKRSPVDTGQYRGSWRRAGAGFGGSGIIAGALIVNDDPKAPHMSGRSEPSHMQAAVTDDLVATQGDDRFHRIRIDMFAPFLDHPGIGDIVTHIPAVLLGGLVEKPA